MWPRTAGVLWCVNLYVGQDDGPARGNKKNLIRFCPVGARCGACPLTKLRLDYEAGDSPGGEPDMIVFLASVGVKDNSNDSNRLRITTNSIHRNVIRICRQSDSFIEALGSILAL
jgi:hypothetical protein